MVVSFWFNCCENVMAVLNWVEWVTRIQLNTKKPFSTLK